MEAPGAGSAPSVVARRSRRARSRYNQRKVRGFSPLRRQKAVMERPERVSDHRSPQDRSLAGARGFSVV